MSRSSGWVAAWATVLLVALAGSSCGRRDTVEPGSIAPSPTPRPSAPEASPSVPTPAPEVTRSPPSPPSHPKRSLPETLQVGSEGPWVRRLQERLRSSTYDPGPIDGRFGEMTLHAVYAFEKVNGLSVDGVVDRRELRTILTVAAPTAEPQEAATYVEVDIGRQVLFEVRDRVVVHTLPVSTGSGGYYQSTSGVAVAHTPRGWFSIIGKIAGWRVGYLGAMYYPSYFYGGYAIHGSASVPPYPASHGCVRIPMHSAIGFFERNPIGTPVFIHD